MQLALINRTVKCSCFIRSNRERRLGRENKDIYFLWQGKKGGEGKRLGQAIKKKEKSAEGRRETKERHNKLKGIVKEGVLK